jgi:hypothetical protein
LPNAFDPTASQQDTFLRDRVWIEGMDTDYRADEVIRDVVDLAREWLAKFPEEANA